MLRIVLVLIFFFSITTLKATEVFRVKRTCPVCKKTFISQTHRALYFGGGTKRDLSDRPYFHSNGIVTCPYCMYSSFLIGFIEIDNTERKDLLKKLPEIQLKLHAEEKKLLSKLVNAHDNTRATYRWMRRLFARECNKIRKKNKKRDMRLLLYMYYASKYRKLKEINSFYRKNNIKHLTILLDDNLYNGKEEAGLTYLLGEFHRMEGHHKQALDYFKKATMLSENLFTSKNWIKKYCFEQSCRINYPNLSVKELVAIARVPDANKKTAFNKNLALELLAKNNDPISWATIRDYLIKDKKHLYELNENVKLSKKKLQIDQKLWQWTHVQYKESLRQMKNSNDETDWVWEEIKKSFARFFELESSLGPSLEDQVKSIIKMENGSIFSYYKVQPDDALQDIYKKNSTNFKRICELNPHIKHRRDLIKEQTIKLIRTESLYYEDFVLNKVENLIALKNEDAVDYFFTWLKTAGEYSFNRYHYSTQQS